MTEAEFKKQLNAAEKSPKEIAAAVSGLTESVLRYKPSPDKWCVLEIGCRNHLWISLAANAGRQYPCHGAD
jgi:hypothetical protein